MITQYYAPFLKKEERDRFWLDKFSDSLVNLSPELLFENALNLLIAQKVLLLLINYRVYHYLSSPEINKERINQITLIGDGSPFFWNYWVDEIYGLPCFLNLRNEKLETKTIKGNEQRKI
jgi:hypothetical protein